jgi:hypothetical protein
MAFDLVRKSVNKTFESMLSQKSNLRKKACEMFDQNKEVLRQYSEGVQELKKYELHPNLKKEKKEYLIDIYYDEQ